MMALETNEKSLNINNSKVKFQLRTKSIFKLLETCYRLIQQWHNEKVQRMMENLGKKSLINSQLHMQTIPKKV